MPFLRLSDRCTLPFFSIFVHNFSENCADQRGLALRGSESLLAQESTQVSIPTRKRVRAEHSLSLHLVLLLTPSPLLQLPPFSPQKVCKQSWQQQRQRPRRARFGRGHCAARSTLTDCLCASIQTCIDVSQEVVSMSCEFERARSDILSQITANIPVTVLWVSCPRSVPRPTAAASSPSPRMTQRSRSTSPPSSATRQA